MESKQRASAASPRSFRFQHFSDAVDFALGTLSDPITRVIVLDRFEQAPGEAPPSGMALELAEAAQAPEEQSRARANQEEVSR